MGNVLGTPRGYEWTEKEKSQCASKNISNTEAQQMISPPGTILVLENKVVVHLVFDNKATSHIESETQKPPKRKYRRAVITRGAMILMKAKKPGSKKKKAEQNLTVGLHDIVGVVMDPSHPNTIEVHTSSGYASAVAFVYQISPDDSPRVLLRPLAEALFAAYRGHPPWAIPVGLPSLCSGPPSSSYSATVSTSGLDAKDGGFCTSFYARLEAEFLQLTPQQRLVLPYQPEGLYEKLIGFQNQQTHSGYRLSSVIDIVPFVSSLMRDGATTPSGHHNNDSFVHRLAIDAVEKCLPFNLVIRRLDLIGVTTSPATEHVQTALSKLLHYNVTLIELNLRGTVLTGTGRVLGTALATNIQPLLSRIDLTDCQLTQDDVEGMVRPGLARLWCGGSALPESIRLAVSSTNNHNPNQPTSFGTDAPSSSYTHQPPPPPHWETLYEILLDSIVSPYHNDNPSALRPPPPSLAFLQTLDVRGTLLPLNSRLPEVIARATNLRTLGIGGCSTTEETKIVVNSVLRVLGDVVRVPHLRTFYTRALVIEDGGSLIASVLYKHSTTLERVVLEEFSGDVTGVLCRWPEYRSGGLPLVEIAPATLGGGGGSVPGGIQFVPSSGYGYGPGSLTTGGWPPGVEPLAITQALKLGGAASGLRSLKMEGVSILTLVSAADALASGGLETLELTPPEFHNPGRSKMFWIGLAPSSTLRTLKLPDQLHNAAFDGDDVVKDLEAVGDFLKTNRSVRSIDFDSSHLILTVEGVKALRSAFYGNKKVIELRYPAKAKEKTMEWIKTETEACLREVSECKQSIKTLFKSHYSKYNRHWKNKPNHLKLPYVDRITVAKRRIGVFNRGSAKIANLLEEIRQCVDSNRVEYEQIKGEKDRVKINNRENQFRGIAQKKEKIARKLISKLHKNKGRGRAQKGGKTQVPRSHYYSNKHMWKKSKGRPTSHWHHLNDPYYMRHHHGYNDHHSHSSSDSSSDSSDDDRDVWEDLGGGQDDFIQDPWSEIDDLVNDNDLKGLLTLEALNEIHVAASELGPDVVADVASILDEAAAVNNKVEDISSSMGVDTSVVESTIASHHVDDFHSEIPEYNLDVIETGVDAIDETADDVDEIADNVDEVVDMYAGAGPRDLDDGGPSFGKDSAGAVAGARRKARTRKTYRALRRVREAKKTATATGYSHLDLLEKDRRRDVKEKKLDTSWPPDGLVGKQWKDEIKEMQIEAMSKSSLFSFPDISEAACILDWSEDFMEREDQSIQVILVTQCSIDRLSNLQSQLIAWNGMASIAVYLKQDEDLLVAKSAILKSMREAKKLAGDTSRWDVAVTLYQSHVVTPYPINFLRNAALLEAKRRQQEMNIEKGAALLVDVDFRPCERLFRVLHSTSAAKAILKERKVIVCPAFECTTTSEESLPSTINDLLRRIDDGFAEGFHLSQFPQGHSPTDFSRFLSISKRIPFDDIWKNLYHVPYRKCFEPYVVMATSEVPLYDERFQGYGLNKISHLASVADKQTGGFHVLPGVFLVALAHERSEAWSEIYGSNTDDANFNRLWLKGLAHNFFDRLKNGKDPMVSSFTKLLMEKNLRKTRFESDFHKQKLIAELQSANLIQPPSKITCDLPNRVLSLIAELIDENSMDGQNSLQQKLNTQIQSASLIQPTSKIINALPNVVRDLIAELIDEKSMLGQSILQN